MLVGHQRPKTLQMTKQKGFNYNTTSIFLGKRKKFLLRIAYVRYVLSANLIQHFQNKMIESSCFTTINFSMRLLINETSVNLFLAMQGFN